MWREGKENCVALPEDDIDIVQKYIHYIYTQKLPVLADHDTVQIQSHENHPEYFVLADLYIFGENIRDSGFKNRIIDAFISRVESKVRNATRCYPHSAVVDRIYRGTMEGSLARKLMLDARIGAGHETWITTDAADHNKEFLSDLSRGLLCSRRRTRKSDFFGDWFDCLEYYEGEEGEY